MADNYNFTPGTGSIGASKDVGGVQFPYVLSAGGTMSLTGGTVTMVGGGGTTTISGSVTIAAGTVTAVTAITNTVTIAGAAANAGGTVTISGGTMTLSGGTVTVALGSVTIASGTLTAVTGITNTVTIAGSVTMAASSAAMGTVTIIGFDKGAGSATATTTRVTIDSTQLDGSEYESVAAATSATLGASGAIGDFLSHVTVFPASTSPGSVSIFDGTATIIGAFAGGASSVSNLVPFTINIGAASTIAGWKVQCGGSVSIVGFGNFT